MNTGAEHESETVAQLRSELIQELRIARLRRRMTLHDLANKCGIGPDRLSRLENCKVQLKDGELDVWMAGLGLQAPETGPRFRLLKPSNEESPCELTTA